MSALNKPPQLSASRGILRGGSVVPSTEWVLREEGAWWAPGDRGTKLRSGHSLIVGHWTAGNAHEGPRTAQRVVRAMKARRRPDNTPMDVGIGFVISFDGRVFQTADLEVATVHVGSRGWNARSIGVELCWPGTATQAKRLGVDGAVRWVDVAGHRICALVPPSEMVRAWVALCEALASELRIPRQVPLDRDGALLVDRMTAKQARGWSGAVEHLHCVGTTKVDAGGFLVGALLAAGWRGVAA